MAEGPFWSQDAVLFTFGHVFSYAYLAGIGYILLAFPSGRLESPKLRGLFWVGAVAAGPLQVAWLLSGGHDQAGSCAGCPVNLLELTKAPDVTAAIQLSQAAIGTIFAAISIAVLVRRWQLASAPLRFAITPVIWAGVAASGAHVLHHLSFALGVDLGQTPALLLDLALALTAVAFLLGVARTRPVASIYDAYDGAMVGQEALRASPSARGTDAIAACQARSDPHAGRAVERHHLQTVVDRTP